MATGPGGARRVRRAVSTALAGGLVGGSVVALPDGDVRVFSLTSAHGPSWLDLFGIAVLLACWLPVPVVLWSSRAALRGRSGAVAAVLAAAGAVLLPVTLTADHRAAWVPAALLLVAAQAVALVRVAQS